MSLERLKEILGKSNPPKKSNGGKFAIGAGIGALLGAAAGLLFAPKSGKETREDIAEGAKNTAEAIKVKIDEAKEKIAEAAKNGRCCCCCEEEEEDQECCCCGEEKQKTEE